MTRCMCALPVDRLVDRRVRLAEPALAGGVHGEPCALRKLGVDTGMWAARREWFRSAGETAESNSNSLETHTKQEQQQL